MQKYSYEYVHIKRGFFKGWERDYREVVDERAKQGWRLVSMFAPAVRGYGSAAYVDLVFEKARNTEF